MNELDGLRDVLSRRADLAPDPDTVLPAVHRKIRRRRNRRRAAGVAGAVAVTVAGLTVASTLLHSPTTTSALTVATPLGRPIMPFTVSHPPAGYREIGWAYDAGVWTADYQDANGSPIVEVQVGGTDSTYGVTGGTDVELHGLRATFGHRQDEPVVAWRQPGSGEWVSVTGQGATVAEDTVLAFARSVSFTRSAPRSMMRLDEVPSGWGVQTWAAQWNSLPDETAVLCPTDLPGDTTDPCVRVTVGTVSQDGRPAGPSNPKTSPYRVERHVGSHWVDATSVSADHDLVRRMAQGVEIF
ncbi:MAG TPA: hypothetical protein VHF06_03075 [Pseudonocardiaceae bacterium]|jgi:hypothetical protein|nr:hypothetical protein [Pseudonocardiaceae bacterium]